MFNTLVIGPDVILSYPDIIPDPQNPTGTLNLYQLIEENINVYGVANSDEKGTPPHELNFDDASLVIPEICIEVLEEARNSKGPKAHAASTVLNRLSHWIESKDIEEVLKLEAFASTNVGEQRITLFPLSKEFHDSFQLDLSPENIAASVAITALAAAKIVPNTCLITNNSATALMAKEFGVQTLPFSPRPEPEYTGIRHMVFPNNLCLKLYDDGCIHLEDFWYVFPEHPTLIPNEYIITYANANEEEFMPGYYSKTRSGDFIGLLDPNCKTVKKSSYSPEDYHETIFRYDAKINALSTCDVSRFIPANNPELAAYKDALARPDIDVIIVTGSAGTGKSYSAFEYALDACTIGEFMHAYVVKEGKNELGAVPGEVDDKMMPLIQYGKDALRSIALNNNTEVKRRIKIQQKFGVGNDKVSEKQSKKHRKDNCEDEQSNSKEGNPKSVHELLNNIVDLQWDNNFTAVPYEQIQGRTLKKSFIIIDEFQRVAAEQADTILTRLGECSKMIIIGDVAQAQGYSTKRPVVDGITYASLLYKGSPNVAQIKLTRGMRHRVVEYAIDRRDRVLRELGLPTD